MIKTFRGLLTDSEPGNQNRIRLQTIKGKVGYKIIKFQIIGAEPGVKLTESCIKIYKTSQTTIDSVINFTDSDLLGVTYWAGKDTSGNTDTTGPIIFDNQIFNQDIYLTHHDAATGEDCNYYLELEVIPLDDAGAEYTTLKDMRQSG